MYDYPCGLLSINRGLRVHCSIDPVLSHSYNLYRKSDLEKSLKRVVVVLAVH